ncbi:MAG TPA: di-heme oxidoredictase family protein, partial [Ilumatobacteraceae bacterium]|nr:di-heme oxidoredictase family protein [Ilumatobacteraceae bacterium]
MQARRARRIAFLVCFVAASCGGSDGGPDGGRVLLDPNLGGGTTRVDASRNSFGLPAPTLDNDERRLFEVGDSFFTQNWVIAPASTTARDGLGPLFNARACASCHVLDGRGIAGDSASIADFIAMV